MRSSFINIWMVEEDEINVPMMLGVFRDKGSRRWSKGGKGLLWSWLVSLLDLHIIWAKQVLTLQLQTGRDR